MLLTFSLLHRGIFLNACSHLYKTVCPSVRRFIRLSVRRLVTHGLKPCKSAVFDQNYYQYERERILGLVSDLVKLLADCYAVEKQWVWSGSAVAVHWVWSGCAVTVQWLCSGCALGVEWFCSGKSLSFCIIIAVSVTHLPSIITSSMRNLQYGCINTAATNLTSNHGITPLLPSKNRVDTEALSQSHILAVTTSPNCCILVAKSLKR